MGAFIYFWTQPLSTNHENNNNNLFSKLFYKIKRDINVLYTKVLDIAKSGTRRVYNLFQDLWNRLIILEGVVKSLWCQGFADRQTYRTGGGARCNAVDQGKA